MNSFTALDLTPTCCYGLFPLTVMLGPVPDDAIVLPQDENGRTADRRFELLLTFGVNLEELWLV